MLVSPRRCVAAASMLADAAHAAEGGHDQSIGGMILGMGWPVANFIIFCRRHLLLRQRPAEGVPRHPQRDHPQGPGRSRRAQGDGHRAAGDHRTEAPGAARRAEHAAHARRRRDRLRREAHCRRRRGRPRTPARADAPRDRPAGAAGEEGHSRARRRPVGAARRRAAEEGNHARGPGASRRPVPDPGEGPVDERFRQPLRQGAVRRRAAGEGRPRADRSRSARCWPR